MRIFRRLLLSLLLFLLLLTLFTVFRYIQWDREFFENNNELICFSNIKDDDLNIDEKIEKFVISDSKAEFVVFSEREILSILVSNIQLAQSMKLEEVCILPSKGIWGVYLKYQRNKVKLPWFVVNVLKDERETAELYVKNIGIGNLGVPKAIGRKIEIEINRGISDAVILLNENRFLGREIRNIELLEDKVIIKGLLY